MGQSDVAAAVLTEDETFFRLMQNVLRDLLVSPLERLDWDATQDPCRWNGLALAVLDGRCGPLEIEPPRAKLGPTPRRVLALSPLRDPWPSLRAVIGYDGVVFDDRSEQELSDAFHLVLQGFRVFDRRLGHTATSEATFSLSERELEILSRISCGEPDKVVAQTLSLSEHTVRAHVKVILRKLGARNRTHAAHLAHRHDLV